MTEAIKKTVETWPEAQEHARATPLIWLPECPKCGSTDGQWRGFRETKKVIHHRRWCKTCGKWFYGNQIKTKPVIKETVNNSELREEKLRFDAWINAYEEALSRGDVL